LQGSGAKQFVRRILISYIAEMCSGFQPVNIWRLARLGAATTLATAPMDYQRSIVEVRSQRIAPPIENGYTASSSFAALCC
jgi:hypothetical protein